MKIFEFARSEDRSLQSVKRFLTSEFGEFDQIGGPKRVYEMDDDQHGIVLVDKQAVLGLALAWQKDQLKNLGISTIYVWPQYDPSTTAPYAIDIPLEFSFEDVKQMVAKLIREPQVGRITASPEADTPEKITEMARRSNDAEFSRMCIDMYGEAKAARLTMPELVACAQENDVQIPGTVRSNPALKVDAHHWNLSGREASSAPNADDSFRKQVGDIETAPEEDPHVAELKAVKGVARMAAEGKVYLFGRKPKTGAFYKIPGADHILAQLERMLSRALPQAGEMSMDEQYEMLSSRVKLVAGGEANFIKSLLITGAPSAGKTFVVMKNIKELGLKEGEDYIVKKGKVTTLTMYRTLIEQVNGMAIFDDCDSVVADKDAVNMLKGALDTDPVREISYDVRGMVNTATMSEADRTAYVELVSRILRGKPEDGDLEIFLNKVRKPYKEDGDTIQPRIEDEDMDELLSDVQEYVANKLPNKIDFKGKIIFISNMSPDEWDGAIITRAFTMDLNFRSDEMLDYIDKIKGHIKTPSLSEDEKQEVMDFLRELYVSGKLKRDVNFRLVQQCFDLRLAENWKKLIAML